MRLRHGLLALFCTLPLAASAQEAPAVQSARSALQASVAARGVAPADLADLAPTDVAFDQLSGATFVYMAQRVNGVEVWATQTPVAVTGRGEAISPATAAFERGLAGRANAPTPAVEAASAVATAAAHLSSTSPAPHHLLTDNPAVDAAALAARPTFAVSGTPRLVYQPVAGGALRLAWALTMEGGSQLWAVRVDAATGAIIAKDDLIAHDTWGEGARRPASFAPLASGAAALGAVAAPSSYRVVPMPNESPAHGAFSLAVNPADPVASPQGWHQTGSTSYTITRGNNGYAYRDSDGNANTPDPGSSPDGGASLVFDNAFDPAQGVGPNAAAAVTSIFYWGNIVHDVTYRYGFDEVGGNFQTTNFTGQGNGNDAVLLEALDASGTNNANFSSPSDGGAGRMQMFEWTARPQLTITAPASVAGNYATASANFGPPAVFSGSLSATGPAGSVAAQQACTQAAITANVTGKVALIMRGNCDFVAKVKNAQLAGAIAVIVYNCDPLEVTPCSAVNPEDLTTMGGTDPTITIPSLFVANSTGVALATATGVQASATAGVNRDSDFDAGVIAHEYGHGISNRLVGGPSNSSCLGNAEQMGEGWSDYVGLMLTMRAGDTGLQRRGVGTYLQFEANDGDGIRPAPYSTNFAVNDYTYQDVISNTNGSGPRALTTPHGVGFAWATMMWDVTWSLIDTYGFSPNIYDATGTAGNQIAMNLYATGLKLTACSPGFVSGRDGILAADALRYPDAANPGRGLHYGIIWRAFARRGLGQNASQGSTSSATDGTADYTVPPGATASEQTAEGGIARLDLAGQNPFTTSTAFALSVDRTQTVRVELLDLLGRSVAVLHDGPVASGAALTLRVSAQGLPSGVYVVRAAGETFSLTERVTVVR